VSAPLFLLDALPAGAAYTVDGPEGHHAAAVQRLRVGETLLLGDGRGATARAVVTSVGRDRLDVTIERRWYEDPPDPRLVVVQGNAKGDRGDLAVQIMTEVGVDEIVPWAAARSVAQWRGERGDRSHRRWVDTAREAAKQARRAWLPAVAPQGATAAVSSRMGACALGIVLHEEARTPLTTVDIPAGGDIVVVVGPEGGITPEELAGFVSAGAVPVRLGTTVLRTSTAGAAALAVLNARLGRW
jgi:16S rRNA (uracil1498-N3)-methyltransferase